MDIFNGASTWVVPAGAVSSFGVGFTLSASLIVAIGAQNAFVLRQGLRREHVGLVVLLCAALDVVLMCIGVLGLSRWAAPDSRALTALVVAGAAFLVAYGWSAARRAMTPSQLTIDNLRAAATPAPMIVLQTLGLTLLNPHVYLDTVMLVGSVGAQQPADTRWAFLVGAGLASTVWFWLLGQGARWLVPLFAKPLAWRWLDGIVAVTMWTLAGLLLWSLWVGDIGPPASLASTAR